MDRDLLLRPNLATMDLRNHIDAELRVGRGAAFGAGAVARRARARSAGRHRAVGVERPL